MSDPRVVAIIQARVSSSRLPRKVLMDIAGRSMLEHVVGRLRQVPEVDEVVIATSTDPSDDEIVSFCEDHDITVRRGSLDDVLERYWSAARDVGADVVVRATSDCPLLDPAVISLVVRRYLQGDVDYASNRLPGHRTYPVGLDVEAFGVDTLDRAHREATQPFEREHVTPYVYCDDHDFRLACVDTDAPAPTERWTVDTAEDLAFVREVFARLPDGVTDWLELKAIVEADPELRAINAHVAHRSFDHSASD